MTINYNDREITLKFSFRADMLFEDATGKTFTAQTESEWLQYMFCTITAMTKDESMKFDDFLDWISDHPTVFYDFIEWYSDYQQSVLNLRKKAEPKKSQSKQKEIKCRAHYYFRLLCFEYKICSVSYFLEEMLLSELQDILDNIQFADRSLWEALRINSFITCQVNSRKKLKLQDIYRLPFDDTEDTEQFTKEDIEQMQQQSKMLEDYINSQQPTETDKV